MTIHVTCVVSFQSLETAVICSNVLNKQGQLFVWHNATQNLVFSTPYSLHLR